MKVRRILLCVLLVGIMCTVGWAQAGKKNVVSGLDVEFYAKIKADASWSDSRVAPGNYVAYVGSEGRNGSYSDNDDEFNLTANATRFGFIINGPETDDWNFWGQLEFDLYGSTTSTGSSPYEDQNKENKPELMTRHAFLVIERPADQWSLLAGQTWDVVAPLNPNTLNYTVLWLAGNMGYRVPQVRLTKDIDITDDTTLQAQFAVARTIGRGSLVGAPSYEPGADEGFPTLQGRLAVTRPGIGPEPITVGVSGHYGREEFDYTAPGGNRKNDKATTWSGCVDATVPLDEKVKVQGEIHTGANLGRYMGGIGYTVMGAPGSSVKEVRAAGGWIAVALGPWDNMCYNVGYGREECDSDDLSVGDRDMNSCLFGNAIYNFNEYAAVGLEVSWWKTGYVSSAGSKTGDGDALVIGASWIYKTR